MQRIGRNDGESCLSFRVHGFRLYSSIHCPFCGKKVVLNDEQLLEIYPCKHTLFVAHDEGFEYRSKIFDDHLEISGVDDDGVCSIFGDEVTGIDRVTNLVDLPDSIKFASYVPAPGFLGSYCGFAALDDDL